MIAEARLRGSELAQELEAMEDHYQRSMSLFLDYGERGNGGLLDACLAISYLEGLRYNRSKRRKGFPAKEPARDSETLRRIAARLSEHYLTEGRGRRCVVEYFRRRDPERHCFLAHPEDYSTSELAYVHEQLRRQTRRSVFDVCWVFRPEDGTLELAAPGSKADAEFLQRVFAQEALGLAALPTGSERCFDLDRLKDPSFPLPGLEGAGLVRAKLTLLRLFPDGNPSQRLTYQVAADDAATVHDLIARAHARERLPMSMLRVATANIHLQFEGENGGPHRRCTLTLTMPDTTNLKDERLHLLVRRHLDAWNLYKT